MVSSSINKIRWMEGSDTLFFPNFLDCDFVQRRRELIALSANGRMRLDRSLGLGFDMGTSDDDEEWNLGFNYLTYREPNKTRLFSVKPDTEISWVNI